MIAALYVEAKGPYNIPGIDVWDTSRDARNYRGNWKVIAHPPCERWGRYWGGGPSAKYREILGDDGGCFAHALWSVRTFGGVVEHPEASHAWRWFGLERPPKQGGWIPADEFGGFTCCVEQGHYGHAARKATWLYAVDCDLPKLRWGKSEGKVRADEGFHSKEERELARKRGQAPIKRLSKEQLLHTPIPFRDLLIALVKK